MARTWSVAAVGLAAVLGACGTAGSARIVGSVKRSGYSDRLDRTIVFFQPGRVSLIYADPFKSRLVAALGARGVRAQLGDAGDKLGIEVPPSINEQAKACQARTALLVGPRDGGVVNSQRRLITQGFDVQVVDLATEKRVWRADLEWTPGNLVTSSADEIVRELLWALESDGLIDRARDR